MTSLGCRHLRLTERPESKRASLGLPDLTGLEGLRSEVHLASGAAFSRRSHRLRCAEVRSGQYQVQYQVPLTARRAAYDGVAARLRGSRSSRAAPWWTHTPSTVGR